MPDPSDTRPVKRAFAIAVALSSLVLTALIASAPASADSVVGQLDVAAEARSLQPALRVDPPDPPRASTLHPQLQRVLELVNAERSARGLPAMRIDDRLNRSAQLHSQDQAARQEMSHIGGDGSRAGDRISRTGYAWRSWAENVAFGFGSAESVMAAWMNSSGHRANILGANTQIGLGLAFASNGAPYWTQVFATPR